VQLFHLKDAVVNATANAMNDFKTFITLRKQWMCSEYLASHINLFDNCQVRIQHVLVWKDTVIVGSQGGEIYQCKVESVDQIKAKTAIDPRCFDGQEFEISQCKPISSLGRELVKQVQIAYLGSKICAMTISNAVLFIAIPTRPFLVSFSLIPKQKVVHNIPNLTTKIDCLVAFNDFIVASLPGTILIGDVVDNRFYTFTEQCIQTVVCIKILNWENNCLIFMSISGNGCCCIWQFNRAWKSLIRLLMLKKQDGISCGDLVPISSPKPHAKAYKLTIGYSNGQLHNSLVLHIGQKFHIVKNTVLNTKIDGLWCLKIMAGMIITGSWDGYIRICDDMENELVRVLHGEQKSAVLSVTEISNNILTLHYDGSLTLWESTRTMLK
jgi:hypothetical protein